MTPLIVKLILVHLGFYVLIAGALALKLDEQANRLYSDDLQRTNYWESRLPAVVFWALAWELTLPFTPWLFRGLIDEDRTNTRVLIVGSVLFIGTLILTRTLLSIYAPRDAHGAFIEGPRVPSAYEVYCGQMKLLNRTQPPHQQFYGTGCP